MKRIFIYALSYVAITASVAATIAVVGPALIKTSDNVASVNDDDNVGGKTNTDDDDEEDEDDDDDIYVEDTDVGCMIQDLMGMSYVNIPNAQFNIVDETSSETYEITLSNIYATLDLTGLIAGDLSGINAKGTLGIKAYGVNVSLDFDYSDAYETISTKEGALVLEEDPYGKCIYISESYQDELDFNPYFSGKMYTNDLFEGVNHVLDELGIELPDLDMDMDMDTNEIISKVSQMTFDDCDESQYKRGTLDLGDLFGLGFALPVNIYCDIQGSMAEKTVKIKGAEILPFEMNGYQIGGTLSLQTVADSSFIITQPLLRDYYLDYSRVFDIFDTIMALSKLRTFGIEFEFSVNGGDQDLVTFGGNAILDLTDGVLAQGNLGITMFGQTLSMTTTYKDKNVYFDVNNMFKVRLKTPTTADVLNYFKELYGNDSLGSVADLLVGFVQNRHVQQLLSGDFSDIEAICSSVVRTGNELIAEINAEAIGLANYIHGQIVLVIDETTKVLKAIYVQGVNVYNYLEDCYYEVTGFVTLKATELYDQAVSTFNYYLDLVNEYVDMAETYYDLYSGYIKTGMEKFQMIYKAINEFDYTDAEACENLFQEILEYTGLDYFAANIDMDIYNYENGIRGDKSLTVTGVVQADMTDAFNKEYPTKTYGMKLYAQITLVIAGREDRPYKLQLQCLNDVVYVVFNDKMKFQMNLTTMGSIVYKIMGLIGMTTSVTPEELEDANNGNVASDIDSKTTEVNNNKDSWTIDSIINSANNVFETVSTIKEYLKYVNSYTIDQDNNYYAISINGEALGMEGNLNVAYTQDEVNGNSIVVTDLISGNQSMDIVAYFIDFDENIYLDTDTSNYLDFNSLELLLDLGIGTLDEDYYHLTGTVNVTIVGDIGLDVQVWIDDDGKLTAKVIISDIPRVDALNLGNSEYYHDDPEHYSKGLFGATKDYGYDGAMMDTSDTQAVLYIQNDMVYIERSEDEVFRCGLDWSGHHDTYYRHAICTLDEFMQTGNMMHYMFETILDLTESIQSSIIDSMADTDLLDMKIEEVLSSYSCTEETESTTFDFGFDLDALSGSDMLDNEHLYIYGTNTELTGLKFTLKIASILSVTANLTLTSAVKDDKEAVDAEIAAFGDCAYVFNETYHETASHPDK